MIFAKKIYVTPKTNYQVGDDFIKKNALTLSFGYRDFNELFSAIAQLIDEQEKICCQMPTSDDREQHKLNVEIAQIRIDTLRAILHLPIRAQNILKKEEKKKQQVDN